MKMIVAIVQDEDSSRLISALMNDGFGVTKLATTGGFLRAGNTTLLIGVDDERFEACLHIIEKLCKSRRQVTTSPLPGGAVNMYAQMPIEVTVGGATVFVLNVEQFAKF